TAMRNTDMRNWEISSSAPTCPLAARAVLVISLRPYCYCAVTISPWTGSGRPCDGVHIHPPLAPGLTPCVQGRGPGGRKPDKENATYAAFGHDEPGLDRDGLRPWTSRG